MSKPAIRSAIVLAIVGLSWTGAQGVEQTHQPSSNTENLADEFRLNYRAAAPGALKAMMSLEDYLRSSGLDPTLLVLVKIRASQINGCAYCLDLHQNEAKKLRLTDDRIRSIESWRSATCFTKKERAALAWTEALTRLSQKTITDEEFQEVRKHFGEKELVDLTLGVIAINGWNRLNVGFRSEPMICPAP